MRICDCSQLVKYRTSEMGKCRNTEPGGGIGGNLQKHDNPIFPWPEVEDNVDSWIAITSHLPEVLCLDLHYLARAASLQGEG